jgi:hypothetical protein
VDRDSARPVIVRIERIKCPRKCGWYREFRNERWWMDQVITHPVYGLVTGQQLVQLDVRNHDCTEAANAKVRAQKRVRERANAKSR